MVLVFEVMVLTLCLELFELVCLDVRIVIVILLLSW